MTFQEIIDTIRECYKDDLDNLIMAFYNMGPWRLVDSKKNSLVEEDYWKAMTPKERLLHIKRFFKLVRKKNDNKGQPKNPDTILSSDGKLELPANASDLRKKPGIRNQKRGVRCSTIPRRKSHGKKEEPIEQDLDVYMEPEEDSVNPQIDISTGDDLTTSKSPNPSRLAQACDKVKKAANKIVKPKRKTKAEKEYEQFLLLAKKFKLPEQDIPVPDFKNAPSNSVQGSMVLPEKPETLPVKRKRGRPRKEVVQSNEPSQPTVQQNIKNKGHKNDQCSDNLESKSISEDQNANDVENDPKNMVPDCSDSPKKVYGEWDVVSPPKDKYHDSMEKYGINKITQMELEEANKKRREQLAKGIDLIHYPLFFTNHLMFPIFQLKKKV